MSHPLCFALCAAKIGCAGRCRGATLERVGARVVARLPFHQPSPLDGAPKTMADFHATVAAVMGSFKAVTDIAKVFVAARDEAQLTALKADLMTKLVEAQQAAVSLSQSYMALAQEKNDLVEMHRALKVLHEDREQYELAEIHGGRLGYRFKGASQQGVPAHYLCQTCYDGPEKRKTVLQRRHRASMNTVWEVLACDVCKLDFPVPQHAP